MNKLSNENIEFISKKVSESGIKSNDLKEDLIDHFCCAVEEYMKKDYSFNESYNKAYNDICPDGLEEIETETVYLLTHQKIKAMKKLLYFSGYLAAIAVTSSFFMKYAHIEGANFLMVISSILLIFFFLPLLFLNLYKREISKILSVKLKYIFGLIGLALFVISLTFKLVHWEGSIEIFFASILVINLAFLPLFFYKRYRKSME